jgi:peptidoglycan/xylan/chitin deacetylase (PgdA/CDA1 family)
VLNRLRDATQELIGGDRLIRRGPASARRVALTFDDGPGPLTGAYLDRLDQLGVPATFFLVGKLVAEQPEVVRDYLRRGHQVAGHGWDHTAFTALKPGALRDQVRRTDAVLGPQPTGRPWVRPPYGAINTRVLTQLVIGGHVVAMWSFDSFDHMMHDVDALVTRCDPRGVAPGEVLLFHEGHEWTLAALPDIVGRLREDGYELVTMFDMFGV